MFGIYNALFQHKSWSLLYDQSLEQQFSTGVPQEFLKHTKPDYLVSGTDLFTFKLSKKKKKRQQPTQQPPGVN